MRILAINGSYRTGGITDQALEVMRQTLSEAGCEVDMVPLREYEIGFCHNCRECTQQPGTAPGRCVQDDAMSDLVARIEAADGVIFASPTNCGAVTALFKRFMERLIVYAYWPWGQPAPKPRHSSARKPAVLVTSSAAPGVMGRLFFGTIGQLRQAAKMIGGRVRGSCFNGLAASAPDRALSDRQRRKAAHVARRLLV
jgi:multimeric flavodoxin WrbA